VRILLIDDHAVVRAGLRQLLIATTGAEVAEAADGEAALAMIAAARPDLVILDLGLPGLGGLSLLPRLAEASLRVLVLSLHSDPIYARRAMEAGALGYVTKGAAPDELIEAVRLAFLGRRYIEQRLAQELAVQSANAGDRLHRLGPRDLEIVRLLAAGRSMTEIAGVLGVSYKTVANTVSAIRARLGVSRTADLLRLAIEMQGGLEAASVSGSR
jgi:DNA-binding NarL/FixJ family response regulator